MAGPDSVNEFFSSSESTQSMQLSSVYITFVCTALTKIIALSGPPFELTENLQASNKETQMVHNTIAA